MNLVVDVGNTRMKYAFFEEERFLEARYEIEDLLESIDKWKSQGVPIHLFLSGSGRIPEELKFRLQELADSYTEASSQLKLPLKIAYSTPATLGFDRIAICVGAMNMYPQTPLLVIDSGTCITFNYVSADGVFLGGNISPGMEMRFKSLHEYTARLPLVIPAENYGGIGKTTEEAIRNGVMDGMLFEIENYIRRFKQENPDGLVVLTGGNSPFLKGALHSPVEFCKNLGFAGLNGILRFIKKND